MLKKLRQPLSAKQTALAVAALLVAAGALFGLYRGLSTAWHRHMLERSIPSVLAGARSQRDTLIALIESYKTHFGYYPPMFTTSGPTRGIINPLAYELLGVRFNTNTAQFYIPVTKDGLSIGEAKKYLNTQSFSNCVTFPAIATNFLANRALSVSPMTREADLFGVALSYTEFTPEEFWTDYDLSPWRYATNPAEHNPGKFDLWVEIGVNGKHFTIGNWPEVR